MAFQALILARLMEVMAADTIRIPDVGVVRISIHAGGEIFVILMTGKAGSLGNCTGERHFQMAVSAGNSSRFMRIDQQDSFFSS